MNTEEYERELIERAQRGDADAGIEALRAVVSALDAGRLDSPAIPYLQDCLVQVCEGVPAARALGVEEDNRGGRPAKYDRTEIAAVDILLRDYGDQSPDQAAAWIEDHVGMDHREVQRIRTEYDARYNSQADSLMESLDRDLLLHLCGSLRAVAASALA